MNISLDIGSGALEKIWYVVPIVVMLILQAYITDWPEDEWISLGDFDLNLFYLNVNDTKYAVLCSVENGNTNAEDVLMSVTVEKK